MSKIHATAQVDPSARLGADIEIGPYCVIGPDVEIGDKAILRPHVVVEGRTSIGSGCKVFPFVSGIRR